MLCYRKDSHSRDDSLTSGPPRAVFAQITNYQTVKQCQDDMCPLVNRHISTTHRNYYKLWKKRLLMYKITEKRKKYLLITKKSMKTFILTRQTQENVISCKICLI